MTYILFMNQKDLLILFFMQIFFMRMGILCKNSILFWCIDHTCILFHSYYYSYYFGIFSIFSLYSYILSYFDKFDKLISKTFFTCKCLFFKYCIFKYLGFFKTIIESISKKKTKLSYLMRALKCVKIIQKTELYAKLRTYLI